MPIIVKPDFDFLDPLGLFKSNPLKTDSGAAMADVKPATAPAEKQPSTQQAKPVPAVATSGAEATPISAQKPAVTVPSADELQSYIVKTARKYGIEPEAALKVWAGEGRDANPAEAWQSTFMKGDVREPSYGPFQLLVGEGSEGYGPGLGDEFMQETGKDPRDPSTVYDQIDFAMQYAAKNGWGKWNGAKRVGMGEWDGIRPQDVRGNPEAKGLARLAPKKDPWKALLGDTSEKIKTLDPLVQDRYAATIAEFNETYGPLGYTIEVNQAARTPEEQKKIKATGVKAASPENTWHVVGGAVDFSIFKNGKYDDGTKGGNSYEKLLAPIAKKHGLANPIRNDVGHFMPEELPLARRGAALSDYIKVSGTNRAPTYTSSETTVDFRYQPKDPMGLYGGDRNPIREAIGLGVPADKIPVPQERPLRTSVLRPLDITQGEYIDNGDGTLSTERTITIQDASGQWMNVPTLFIGEGQVVDLADNEEAVRATVSNLESNGTNFERYASEQEAVEAAKERSASKDRYRLMTPEEFEEWKKAGQPQEHGVFLKEVGKGLGAGAVNLVGGAIKGGAAQATIAENDFRNVPNRSPEEETAVAGLVADLQRIPDMTHEEWVAFQRRAVTEIRGAKELGILPMARLIRDGKMTAEEAAAQLDLDAMLPGGEPIPMPDVTDSPVYQYGESWQQWAGENLAAAQDYEDSWTRKISEGLGSTIPFLATAPLGGAGLVAGTALGSFASTGEAIDRAVQAGATKEQIVEAARLGKFPGMTEQIPIEVLFERVPLPAAGKLATAIGKVLTQAAVEGGQEAVQQVAQNLISKYTYNPDQDITEGVAEAAGIGAIVGGGLSAGVQTGQGVFGGRSADEEATSDPAEHQDPEQTGWVRVDQDGNQPATPQAEPRAEQVPAPPGQSPDQPPRGALGRASQVGADSAATATAEAAAARGLDVGTTVRVDLDGTETFMATIDSFADGEAVVHDASTGEIYQIPFDNLTPLAGPPGSSPRIQTPESTDAIDLYTGTPSAEPVGPLADEYGGTRLQDAGEFRHPIDAKDTDGDRKLKSFQTSTSKGGAPFVPNAETGDVATGTFTVGTTPADTEGLNTWTEGARGNVSGDRFDGEEMYDGKVPDAEPVGDLAAPKPVVRPQPVEEAGEDENPVKPLSPPKEVADAPKVADITEAKQATPADESPAKSEDGNAASPSPAPAPSPAPEAPPEAPPVRRIAGRDANMPDDDHALLYDLGGRLRSGREGNLPMARVNDLTRDLRLDIAERLNIPESSVNEIANDYLRRATQAAKAGKAVPALSAKLLERFQAKKTGTRVEPELDLDQAAHQAATSPLNDLPEPTDAQKEATNYRLGHFRLGGMDISIENPAGSTRSGTSPDGTRWSTAMKAHYGRVKGSVGADGDHVDVFVKPGTKDLADDAPVFVIDQIDPDGRQFDETKTMIGWTTPSQARRAYLANYSKGWKGLGAITPTTVGEFREWARSPDATKPFAGRRLEKEPNGATEGNEGAARTEQSPTLQDVAEHDGSLRKSEQSRVSQLRRTRDSGASKSEELSGVPERGRRTPDAKTSDRQDRQRRQLRAGKSEVGNEEDASTKHAEKPSSDRQRTNKNADGVGRGNEPGAVDNSLPSGNGDERARRRDDSSQDKRSDVTSTDDATVNRIFTVRRVVEASGTTAVQEAVAGGRSNKEILEAFRENVGTQRTSASTDDTNGTAFPDRIDILMPDGTGKAKRIRRNGRDLVDDLKAAFSDFDVVANKLQKAGLMTRFGTIADPDPKYPSRLFKHPVSYADGALTLNHPLLAKTPFVKEVERVSGLQAEPAAEQIVERNRWFHAVDMATNDRFRDLLDSAEYSTPRLVIEGGIFNFEHRDLTPANFTALLEEITDGRPGEADVAAVFAKHASAASTQQGKALQFDKKETSAAERGWAWLHAWDNKWVKPKGDFLMLSPAGIDEIEKPSARNPENIEDFGEVLHGARKMLWSDYAKSLKADVDIEAEPLSKSFPVPNYARLAEEGVSGETLALVALMRDEIPAKPRAGWKIGRWAKQVETLRGFAESILSDPEKVSAFKERARVDPTLRALVDTAEAIKDVEPGTLPKAAEWRVEAGRYTMYAGVRYDYDNPKVIWTIRNRKQRRTAERYGFDAASASDETRDGIIEKAGKIIPALVEARSATPERSKYTKVDLYRDRGSGGVYLGFKVRSSVIRLKDGFDSIKDARAYLAENRDALQQQIDTIRSGPNERNAENRDREGRNWRDADITPETFADAFGFRGVQFGNYVEGKRRQDDLNRAYDALMDLADALGIPPRALSLNGELGLAFGARGKGGKGSAAAHYEPGSIVINLTKNAGPGSLAHEWLHGLDNYFARQDGSGGEGYASSRKKSAGGMRSEVFDAWKGVEDAITTGDFYARSKDFDKARSKDYWSTTIELAARGFERYIVDRLDASGIRNDYLANIDLTGGAYPTDTEMAEGIKGAYDNLFDVIEAETTDTGDVRLYSEAYPTTPDTMPERIVSAAVRVDDNIYRGNDHAEAAEKAATERGETIDDLFNRNFDSDGFLTSAGRYVDRKEAAQIAAQADQIDQIGDRSREESRNLVLATEELLAEQIDKSTLQRTDERVAPSGWGAYEPGDEQGPNRLSKDDRAELERIVKTVSGLDTLTYVGTIPLPNGAPGWGSTSASSAAGFYHPVDDAITLALDTATPRAAYHEAFHRLQYLFLTDKERALLVQEKGRLRRIVAGAMGRENAATRMSQKELEAEAFAIYAAGKARSKPYKTIRAVWDKIANMIERVRNYLNGRGFMTLTDVFEEARTGRASLRTPSASRGGVAYSTPSPIFYSATAKAVAGFKQDKATADQWLGMLRKAPGVKPEEIEWLGLEEWLKSQRGGIERTALADFIAANEITVGETVLEGMADVDDEAARQWHDMSERAWYDDATESEREVLRSEYRSEKLPQDAQEARYGVQTLPGGAQYRELLLQLPLTAEQQKLVDLERMTFDGDVRVLDVEDIDPEMTAERRGAIAKAYESPHWDQLNVLAHIRFNERFTRDAAGERPARTLFIEEVQSDWHQEGRKKGYDKPPEPNARTRRKLLDERQKLAGEAADMHMAALEANDRSTNIHEYLARDPEYLRRMDRITEINATLGEGQTGVPDAPFKTTWPELAFKRALKWAVDNGYDRIAWTPGGVQIDRYDLSERFDNLRVLRRQSDGAYFLSTRRNSADYYRIGNGRVNEADLEKLVGKELADKIKAGGDNQVYTDIDISIGGAGMRAFYDRILPKTVGKLVKKWDGAVGTTTLQYEKPARGGKTATETVEAWSLDITDAMRDPVRDGLPLFSLPDSTPPVATSMMFDDRYVTRDGIIGMIKGAGTDVQPHLLAAVPFNYFTELARPGMTAVGDYMRVKRRMDAFRGDRHAESDEVSRKWLKYTFTGIFGSSRPGKKRAFQLAKLMHDTTLAGIDPSNPRTKEMDPTRYDALRERFDALPKDGQNLYREVRDAYSKQQEMLDQILLDNVRKAQLIADARAEEQLQDDIDAIDRNRKLSDKEKEAKKAALKRDHDAARTKAQWSMKARLTKLRIAFESSRVESPYFPLARFGRYYVLVRDVDGEVLSFSKRESAAARDRLAKELRESNPFAEVTVGVMEEGASARDAMDPRLIAEIEQIVGGAGLSPDMSADLLDSIWQRYLSTLPDLSLRKRFIHRKGTPGYDQDALRTFSSHMFHASHQMARLKYGMELGELVNAAARQAKEADDPTRAVTLANEMRKRHTWVMNPMGGRLAQRLNTLAFIYYLGATPAAALVNLAQTPMMGIPVLGSRFGSAKASAALLKASRDAVAGGGLPSRSNLTADERKAMDEFYSTGVVDRTQSHDLAGVGDTGVNYNPARARAMEIVSWAFHNAEVVNREVTALAAYRLARDSGKNFTDAVDAAHELTYTVHYDYANSSRPRLMQNDFAKATLVFKAYAVNTIYRISRDLHQSLKGETKEVRSQARKQLVGILAMQSVFAGVTGIAGFNALMSVADFVLDFFEDDDEPYDLKDRLRKQVIDAIGPELGGILLDGLPGHYAGISLTERIGSPDLWFRSPNRDMEPREAYEKYVLDAAGATVSLGGDWVQSIVLAKEGRALRAIEKAAPKFVGDLFKAMRYANEGVTDYNDNVIVPREEIDGWDLAMQAAGFTPAKIAEAWDRKGAAQDAEGRIMDERQRILNRLAKSIIDNDPEARKAALEEVKAFNAVDIHAGVRIKPDTVRRSVKTRVRNARKREDGILIQNERLSRDLRERLPERVY